MLDERDVNYACDVLYMARADRPASPAPLGNPTLIDGAVHLPRSDGGAFLGGFLFSELRRD